MRIGKLVEKSALNLLGSNLLLLKHGGIGGEDCVLDIIWPALAMRHIPQDGLPKA